MCGSSSRYALGEREVNPMDPLTCSMCPAPIHPARHIALPRTTTCSPECSSDRERWRKRESARRRRQELKALKGPTP